MEQENENSLYLDKRQFCLSMIVLTVLTIVLFLSVFIILKDDIKNINLLIKNLENETVFQEEQIITNPEEIYVIKEYDNRIGVFANGDLKEIVDIYVFSLPENDKKLLSEGICITSKQELNEILSCYY